MRKIIYYIFFISFITFNFQLYSQKEANNWYFGSNCGMTFNTSDNSPKALTNGQLNSDEGCAAISDWNGNLLFYTDGVTIWNRYHIIMPNGEKLYGNTSSTQSAVIIPKPHSTTIFYVFTVDRQANPYGLRYSTVDMKLNNGNGDVINKNVALAYPVCEKITAVKHQNGRDIWVIAHEWNSNNYLAYLVTDTGVVKQPIISGTGTSHTGNDLNTSGYLKASPDGRNLAVAIYYSGIVEICNFNNNTGITSNPMTFTRNDSLNPYGIEFSPDASKLYISCVGIDSCAIYQIDLKAGTQAQIKNSVIPIAISPYAYSYHALQFAPNRKIYVAKRGSTNLSSIENPNLKGSSCGFVENSFDLLGRKSKQGLPTFNQSFIDIFVEILGNSTICKDDSLILRCTYFEGASYLWSGPGGFTSDSSVVIIPKSEQKNSGYYKVILKYKDIIKIDSILVNVVSKPSATILEGNVAYLCEGNSITIHSLNDTNSFKLLWPDSSNKSYFNINKAGKYYLIVENQAGCQDTAYINIIISKKPIPVIISDYTFKICPGKSLKLFTNKKYSYYNWSTGETTDTISVSTPGKYSVSVTNEYGCTGSSEVIIEKFDILYSTIKDVNFGNTLLFTKKTTNVEFYNTGTDSFSVISVYLGNYSRQIQINVVPLPYIWLKPGEKIDITLNFNPDSIADFSDSLFIEIEQPCSHTISAFVSGSGSGLVSKIWMPDTLAKIGDKNFIIPVYAKLSENNSTYNLSFNFEISFNAKIFIPDLNQEGILSDQIIGSNRNLKISKKNVQVTGDTNTIFEIFGTVLLCDSIIPLKFINFEWDNKNILINAIDGSIHPIGVCQPGISNIRFFIENKIEIFPNPSFGNITIKSKQKIDSFF